MSRPPSLVLSVPTLLLLTSVGMVHVASEVRLVDGPVAAPNAGRVEVWDPDFSQWLTVCADGWNFTDGQVVCKELGYPGTASVDNYGVGSLKASVGGFNCTGDENHLFNCSSLDPKDAPCNSKRTAGVACAAPGYRGCKVDDDSEPFRGFYAFQYNTVEKCIEFAREQSRQQAGSVPYAGMQGMACWYDARDLYPKSIAHLTAADDSMCAAPCPGNAAQSCAGSGHFAVYSVTDGFCNEPQLSNGNVMIMQAALGESFYFGTVVRFTCNPGFGLEGSPSAQCILGAGPAQVQWSSSPPECLPVYSPTATEDPSTADGSHVVVAFVLSIVNAAILVLLIVVILIGLYCCMPRRRNNAPNVPARYNKMDSPVVQRRSVPPPQGVNNRAGKPGGIPAYSSVHKSDNRRSGPRPGSANPAFEMTECRGRPVSNVSTKSGANRTSRPQVDENEEILGTIVVSPLSSSYHRERRSQHREEPAKEKVLAEEEEEKEEEEEVWVENETYDSVDNNARFSQTRH